MSDMAFLDGTVKDTQGNPINMAAVVIEKEDDVDGKVDRTNPSGYYMVGEIPLLNPDGDTRNIICWRRPIEVNGKTIRYKASFVTKVLVKGINHQDFVLEERQF